MFWTAVELVDVDDGGVAGGVVDEEIHVVEVGPKLPTCKGHIVEANLQPLNRLPRQAMGVEAAGPATLRLAE